MITKNSPFFFALLLCCLPFWATSQKAKADKLYDELGYKLAIPAYEKMEELSQEDLARIANSYRLNHDTENAEIWYAQLVQGCKEPIHFLYYAQMLQSNGRLELAKANYLTYSKMLGSDASDNRGQLLANAIDRIAEFKHTGVALKNEAALNTESMDFSPAYFKNGIVFVSSRGMGDKGEGRKDKWTDDHFMALFYASENENGSLNEPEPFSHTLTTKYHEGPVVFAQNDRKIFFTRNDFNNGKRRNNSKGVMKQNIYTSTWEDNNWLAPTELPFNTVEYEEVHPAISPDGTRLFFASDRPGGYGEMDLYMVSYSGGKWGTPVNLGPEINTPGNELFPFVHDDGTLYFSSDGWGGLGGLDIFSSYSLNDSIWMQVKNMGTPFNSSKDDFGFILNVTKTEGYLSSDREGGVGKDDIYSFKISEPIARQAGKVPVTICVSDAKSAERLKGATVTVSEITEAGGEVELNEEFLMRLVETDQKNEYILKLKRDIEQGNASLPIYTTDENGEFSMELRPGSSYKLEARKNGYLLAEKTIGPEGEDLAQWAGTCVPIVMDFGNCLVLEGKTVNGKLKNKNIPGVTVMMINLCTGEEVKTTSSKDGTFVFPCLECDCEFLLRGEKTNFQAGVADVTTVGRDCESGGVLTTEILLSPVNSSELLFAGQKIKVGEAVELKNIFYDFDQSYIRDDARADLDLVVDMMKQYPSMVIEIGSHTDSRGTREYNQQLSQARAEAAVDYISLRGIDRRRIIARGYGESQPRNGCRDDVECTEEEHQFNRRTEVRILYHQVDGLDVKYIDNPPGKIDRAPKDH
ncbi:MAG: PD40 domain-containing protein [Lewinellaceae bacterium]|nr:PD40 domain-containing protein [Saprospiraceae bacterium]MCB9341117.1 PD40 domain-containing protein [Lewinellaceae bacterium]